MKLLLERLKANPLRIRAAFHERSCRIIRAWVCKDCLASGRNHAKWLPVADLISRYNAVCESRVFRPARANSGRSCPEHAANVRLATSPDAKAALQQAG